MFLIWSYIQLIISRDIIHISWDVYWINLWIMGILECPWLVVTWFNCTYYLFACVTFVGLDALLSPNAHGVFFTTWLHIGIILSHLEEICNYFILLFYSNGNLFKSTNRWIKSALQYFCCVFHLERLCEFFYSIPKYIMIFIRVRLSQPFYYYCLVFFFRGLFRFFNWFQLHLVCYRG